MSAIQFLTSGGMASIGGDLPEEERKQVNEVIKNFGEKVKNTLYLYKFPLPFCQYSNALFYLLVKILRVIT